MSADIKEVKRNAIWMKILSHGSSTCQDPGAGVWSGAQELKGATNDCGGRARGAEAGTGDSEQGGGVTGNVHVFCRLRTVTSE